jgi:hypothetical protein
MANIRKSTGKNRINISNIPSISIPPDGRKRARTMEYKYIDSQVDINDVDTPESNIHIGQHIHAQFDVSMSLIDESDSTFESSIPKIKTRDSEKSYLQRQMSDITLNRFVNETNKTTTEFKGRDHVLRVMKTTTNKPVMDLKNHKFIQEMIAKRQEKQEVNRPISDFALNYGLIDNTGKKSKSRKTSELM